jgi:hypothetical protein
LTGGQSSCGRLRFWYKRRSNDPPVTRGRAGCATRRGGAQGGRGVVHRRSLASVPEVAAGAAWCVQRRRTPDGAARKPRVPGLGHAGRGDALNRAEGAGCTVWRVRQERQGRGGGRCAAAPAASDRAPMGLAGLASGLRRTGSGLRARPS